MLYPHLRNLMADRSGATAILIGVMALVIIGFTSLGAEVVDALAIQRKMQAAADSAAISAANAVYIGFPTDPTQEGYAIAAAGGFNTGQGAGCAASPTVYVGQPSCSDPAATAPACASPNQCVEVLIARPFELRLANVVTAGNFMLHARAVAVVPNSTNGSCTVALGQGPKTVLVNGLGSVTYGGCSIAANSNDPGAVWANGGAGGNGSITADNIYTEGSPGYGGSGNILAGPTGSAIACSPSNTNCVSKAAARLNPYEGTIVPNCGGSYQPVPNNATTIGTSGVGVVNCFKDVSLTGGKSLTLAPGTYVIASTKNNSPALNVSGGSTLTGLGVTIFLAGTVPTVNIQSNANVNLVAPTAAQAASTGGTKGLLFYSNSSGSSSFMGGGSMTLQGAIDLPNQDITFGGNTSTAAAQQCTVIVSKTMTFSGATNIGSSGCSALGTQTVANPGTLIE